MSANGLLLAVSLRQDKPFPPAVEMQGYARKGKKMQASADGQTLWRPVFGFEGRYEAGDDGRIKSLLSERFLSPGRTSKGYLSVGLYLDVTPKKLVSTLVHRAVWSAFNGPIRAGRQINHIDGDKFNNRLVNLECVTQSENMLHAIGHLPVRRYRGSEHSNSKLTDRDVWQIREATEKLGFQKTALARAFKVDPRTIDDILSGRTWALANLPTIPG